MKDVDCREWKLVVTGHSLGAGAAALVALYAHNFFPRWVPTPEVAADGCSSLTDARGALEAVGRVRKELH